jgi:hypothetical protein
MRHARRGLFYTCALMVILMAVAVAIADRLLPLVQQHPDKIAAWLIERAGRPVHFDSAEAHWTNRGPVFALTNLRIGEGKQQLAVDHAELLVAMYAGMLPDHPFTELRLHGLALTVERDASGQWHFVGLSGPHENENHDPLQNLEGLGELQVSDAKLIVRAPAQGIAFTSPRVDVRMRVTDKRLRVGLRVDAARGSPMLAVLDFNRGDNSGKLWIGGKDIDLAPWSPLIDYAGVALDRGRGQIGLWGTLVDRRVVSVQADANLHDLAFRGHASGLAEPGMPPSVAALAGLQATGHWESVPGGWRAQASRLRLRNAVGEESLDGIAIQDLGGFALAAAHVGGECVQIVWTPDLSAAVAAVEFAVVAVQPHPLAGDHAAEFQFHAAFAGQSRLGGAELVEQGAADASGSDHADRELPAACRDHARPHRRDHGFGMFGELGCTGIHVSLRMRPVLAGGVGIYAGPPRRGRGRCVIRI